MTLIIVGFTSYYLVPLSLFKNKLTLFFLLMDLILVMVILGLTFISMLIFEYLERFLLWIGMNTCCRCDRVLHHIVSKNMDSHRRRNSNTSIMFTLAIGFLIFSASSFMLLSTLITKTFESVIGADIKVSNYGGIKLINEVPIANFLD